LRAREEGLRAREEGLRAREEGLRAREGEFEGDTASCWHHACFGFR